MPTPGPDAARSGQEENEHFAAALKRQTPLIWVTPTIVAINVVVFAFLFLAARSVTPPPNLVLAWGANFAPKTQAGEWWRLISSMFLHFGIFHVGLNMWVLWGVGSLVERLVGNLGFAVLYFVAGLAGSLASLAWDPSVTSAGASGAVFGVCGALLGFITRRRDALPPGMLKSLRSSMFAFIGYNLVFGFVIWGINKAVPGGFGIDNAAHLGGLTAGFLCGLVLAGAGVPSLPFGRLLRAGTVLIAGSLVIFVGYSLLPAPPPDAEAEFRRFSGEEYKLLRRYDELATESRSGTLTDAQFADALETEVLADWKRWRLRMAALETAPRANPGYIREVGRSMLLREQSWEALVAGIRQADPELIQEHRKKWDAAEDVARQFRGER